MRRRNARWIHRLDRSLLLRHAAVVVTMDDAQREIADGVVLVRGNRIEQLGATGDLPAAPGSTTQSPRRARRGSDSTRRAAA